MLCNQLYNRKWQNESFSMGVKVLTALFFILVLCMSVFFSSGFQASVSYLNTYILCIYWHFSLYLALGPGPMLSHVTLGAMQCLEMVVYWLDYTATYQQLYKYKHDLNCNFSASPDLPFLPWSLSINTNIYMYLHVHTHTYVLKKKILKCLLPCTQQHSTGIHENFQHPTRKIFIL